jgi:hypothetical protein
MPLGRCGVSQMTDTFTHKGMKWTRRAARPRCSFVLGLDLGQMADSTAVCILEHQVKAIDEWEPKYGNTNLLIQKTAQLFDVRHLERYPLGTPYPVVVQHVRELLSRPPLSDGCAFVLDQTGVGAGVADLFEMGGLKPVRVTITSGDAVTEVASGRWHVSKRELISSLDARIATAELRIAKALTEAGALADELKDFRRHTSDAGRNTYSARSGAHDDLVLAVSLCTWWTTRRTNGEHSWGTYKI